MSWWNDLSARERMLVMIAAGLAGVLFISLAIVRPLSGLRADAARKAAAARDGYELTAAAAAMAGGSDAGPQVRAPMRQTVIETARAAGIELVRIGTEKNGQLEIQAAPMSGDVLFDWLALLQSRHGATVALADIARGEEGVVTPQILVLERR